MSTDSPRDPVTGRALLGGRARRAEAPWHRDRRDAIVLVDGVTVDHLVDLRARFTAALCGMVHATSVATGGRPLCRSCRRFAAKRGLL